MPYSIVYHSKAHKDFSLSQIELMLIKAKRFNKSKGITGCIIYCEDQFIQIIEGKRSDILDLYASIQSDDRHYEVNTLIETATEATLWDEWAMAFYNFSNDSKQYQHNRMLLEAYFEQVQEHQRASELFATFKSHVIHLISS